MTPSTCYCCQILTELGFSTKIFERRKKPPSNIAFHETPSMWEQCCSMRTHRDTGGGTNMAKLTVTCVAISRMRFKTEDVTRPAKSNTTRGWWENNGRWASLLAVDYQQGPLS